MECVPGPVHRITTYLAISYWNGRCIGLPDDDTTLAQLARVALQHFTPIKTPVFTAFNEIRIDLDQAFKKAAATYQIKLGLMTHATAVRVAKQRHKRSAKMSPTNLIALAPMREDTTHNTQTTHQTIPQPRERQNDATVSPGKIAPLPNGRPKFTD